MSDAPYAPAGVCPVLEVPFTPTGQVDLNSFERLIAHVMGTGIDAIMFPGFASEYHKLSHHERRQLTTLLTAAGHAKGIPVIVSVPEHATVPAVQEALWAVEQGADAINVLPPYQLSPPPEQVTAHLRTVLTALDPTPVMIQYAPAQTGATMTAEALTGLARGHGNLAAVKVETPLPGRLVQALAGGDPPLPVLVGYAGLQLPDALRRGAAGVQPGCSFVELYVRLWHDWAAGRSVEALALHRRMLPYLVYWMQEVELIIAAEKLISQHRGLIISDHCRRPARILDQEETLMVQRFLDEFADLLPGARR